MSYLNKEIRISAVDAGYLNTIDRLSDETKKRLTQDNDDIGVGEIIEEAEQKFKSVGDQVRYIAEELNKLKVGSDVFTKERARVGGDYDSKIRRAYDSSDDYEMQRLHSEKRRTGKQIDKDEVKQNEVNERLSEILDNLNDTVKKQVVAENKKRPTSDQIDQDDKQQKKWFSFFSFGKKKDKLSEEEQYKVNLRRSTVGQRVGGIVTHTTGNSAIGQGAESLIAGAGGAVALITLVTGVVMANNEWVNKRGRISGMTSLGDRGLREHYNFSTNGQMISTDMSQLGKSFSDMMQYIVPILKSRGTSEGSLQIGTRQMRLEKAFGLDEGSISRADVFSRADNTAKDASKQILLFMSEARSGKLFGFEKGDFVQLSEKIDQFGRLTALQGQQAEVANQRMSMRLIEAGGEIGGSFADQRGADQWSKLNSAVATPQGNFRQAYIMNRLHNSNPKQDYFDVRKRMEQGIFGEGNLKALLGGVTPQGSGKAAMDDYFLRIQSLTGLSFSASEILGKKIHGDRTFLDRYSHGDKKAMGELGFTDDQGRSLQQRANENVGNITASWATTKSVVENALPSMKESLLKIANKIYGPGQFSELQKGSNNKTK